MPKKNEIINLEITDMTQEGSGVGHLDGMAVFVPASAVGDKLAVRLIKVNKTHCFGKIEEILEPSPDRITPNCSVSKRCGGCVFRHVSYEAELKYKYRFVQQNMLRIGGFQIEPEPIIPSPIEEEYRNKAQYPVRMQKNRICAGFFAAHSHEVIDCHDCKLQPSAFAGILEIILNFARETKLTIYDEKTGEGLLRHVYLREGIRIGERMVCLVVNGTSIPKSERLVRELLLFDNKIVSIVLSENTQTTNVILGKHVKVLYGKENINDVICDLQVSISPLAFYQVNTLGAEKLYKVAEEYAGLTGEQTLLDLYCGAGSIGLSMASSCKEIIGVEIVRQAIENARSNAVRNNIRNARFFCADAAQAAVQLKKDGVQPDVVMLDPPRKGCSIETLTAVAAMAPSRIVMISCNSATMARDCAKLAEMGYFPQSLRPVDMFPRTAHVEVVVSICRKDI